MQPLAFITALANIRRDERIAERRTTKPERRVGGAR